MTDFSENLRSFLPRLWRQGLLLSKDGTVAEDLVQAVLLKCLEKPPTLTNDGALGAYLAKMLYHHWVNQLRKEQLRNQLTERISNEPTFTDGQKIAEDHLQANRLLSHIADLPEAQKIAIHLVYIDGFSYAEASDILDIPIGTVMSRLARGRESLHSHFDNETISTHRTSSPHSH